MPVLCAWLQVYQRVKQYRHWHLWRNIPKLSEGLACYRCAALWDKYVFIRVVSWSKTLELQERSKIPLSVIYFGALTTSIITTLRKFFTILFSVLIFGDEIDWKQKIGAGVVFIGIILDITAKKTKVEPLKPTMNEPEEIKMSLLSKGTRAITMLMHLSIYHVNSTIEKMTQMAKRQRACWQIQTTTMISNMKYLTLTIESHIFKAFLYNKLLCIIISVSLCFLWLMHWTELKHSRCFFGMVVIIVR